MTGIRELFAEYSGEDVDWFQMAFWFERQLDARRESNRESQRRYDLRKHGIRKGRRGRPPCTLTPEERRARNAAYQRKWQAKQRKQLTIKLRKAA